jgi:hypothetical protein
VSVGAPDIFLISSVCWEETKFRHSVWIGPRRTLLNFFPFRFVSHPRIPVFTEWRIDSIVKKIGWKDRVKKEKLWVIKTWLNQEYKYNCFIKIFPSLIKKLVNILFYKTIVNCILINFSYVVTSFDRQADTFRVFQII